MRRVRVLIGVDDLAIHDMRRAVSNWLKNQGVGREVRDLILNHADTSVDGEHYSQAARMELQVGNAMQSWADHVWQITGQSVGSAGGSVHSFAASREKAGAAP